MAVKNEISEAEKAQMLAEANMRQEGGPPPVTQKIGPDMEPAPLMADGPVPPPITPSSGTQNGPGDPGEWGPYNGYEVINTGFGEYGLEKGKILFFELGQTFNAKIGSFIEVRLPRYRLPNQSREDAILEFNQREAARPVRA